MSPDEQTAHLAIQSLSFSNYTARLDLGQAVSLRDLIDFYHYTKGKLAFKPFQAFIMDMKAHVADVAHRWIEDSPNSDASRIMKGIARGFIVLKDK